MENQPNGEFAEQQWRLVEQDYPFFGDAGEFICAVHEKADGDGRSKQTEFYHLERLNAALADDPELQQVALRDGDPNVTTCDEAREVMRIRLEREESQPSLVKLPSESSYPEEPREERSRVDKIIDGRAFIDPRTVLLRMWNESGGWCSGTLIGPQELITAAHCFNSGGLTQVTVRMHDGTCISHTPNSACDIAPTGSARANVGRAPWDGTSDVGDDVAVVVNATPWASPANDDSHWMRVARDGVVLHQSYWLEGYGFQDNNETGAGVLRLSNNVMRVDWSGTRHFFAKRIDGDGGMCEIDSGGGGVNTEIYIEDILVGPHSSGETDPGDVCTRVGGKMRKPHIGGHWSLIESTIGRSCNRYSSNGFDYRRCW